MNVEKLIKRVADKSTPELFSEILKKAGAEGLVPESKAEKYTPSKKPRVNKGVVISVVTAVTVAAAGMGIGIPLALNSSGAPATPSGPDSGFVTPETPAPETPENPTPETPTPENPAPETPVTPTPENPAPETPVAPHEHVYGEWKLVTAKSCDADGLREHECECGDKEQEAIPMGHEYQYDNDINHHWQVCTACGTQTQEESHDFGAYETCTVCDYCEELYILDDEKDMYFQLVNGEYYGFTGISKPLDKLTELRIPDFWQNPMEPELGWLPVAVIGLNALEGENLIRKIKLPVGLIYIENWAFSGMTNLREVSMGDGVKYIGKEAFAHCENLKDLYLPDTLTDIAPDAFDFSGIETIRIPTIDYHIYNEKSYIELHYYNMPSLKNFEFGLWQYHYKFENGLLTYCNSLDDIGSNTISTRLITFLDGADVSTGYNSIWDNAFRNKQLEDTDLYLPSDLVYIGFNAFNNCNIKSIHIGADVELIMNDAFTYAPDLTDIYYSGTIDDWKFIEHDAANKKGLVIHCSDGNIVC